MIRALFDEAKTPDLDREIMRVFSIQKAASLIMAGVLALGACACSAAGTSANKGTNGKLKVVTTIFPEYDWVKQVAGSNIDNIELTLLLDNGVDMHSFQPTAQDIIKISTCDVFVFVGGESDEWVKDAFVESNKDMQIVNLLELLGENAVTEEIVEGMQAEEEDGAEEEYGKSAPEYDEHVWLSLRNAQIIVSGIADAMGKADPANAASYKANAEAYNLKLKELDGKYAEAVANGSKDAVLFADRFPFRYMTDDYGLKYYAAFAGCSAETEASFETVVFLSGKIDELGLDTVLVIEGADHSMAQTIIDNTESKNQEILVMDSMQATTSADSAKGTTYVSVMESNLEVLKKALG